MYLIIISQTVIVKIIYVWSIMALKTKINLVQAMLIISF